MVSIEKLIKSGTNLAEIHLVLVYDRLLQQCCVDGGQDINKKSRCPCGEWKAGVAINSADGPQHAHVKLYGDLTFRLPCLAQHC